MLNNKIRLFVITLILGVSFTTAKGIPKDRDTTFKTLAILPFTVSIDTNNLPVGINTENIIRSTKISRFRYQQNLFIWLTKNAGKNRADVQSIITTNDLLKQAGILDSISVKSKEEVCKILGVDGIIIGKLHMAKPKQSVGSNTFTGVTGIIVTPDNIIELEVNLYDSAGKEIWNHLYDEHWSNYPEETINTLLKRSAKALPHKK